MRWLGPHTVPFMSVRVTADWSAIIGSKGPGGQSHASGAGSPRVAAGHLALELLVDAEHEVDRYVAVGVDAELPAVRVRLARDRLELLRLRDEQAVVVRAPDVGLGQPGRALRDGAVAGGLHRPH